MTDYLSINRDYSSSCTSSSTVFPASIQESCVFSDEYIIDDNTFKCYDQQQHQAQTLICIHEQYDNENNVDDFFNVNHQYQSNSQQNIQLNEITNQDHDYHYEAQIQNYQIQPIHSNNTSHQQQHHHHYNQNNKQTIINYNYPHQKTQNYEQEQQQNQNYYHKQQSIQNYINQQPINQNYSQQNFFYQQKQPNFTYQQQFQHNQFEPSHDQYYNQINEQYEQKMNKIVISNQQVEKPIQNQYIPAQYSLQQNQQNQQYQQQYIYQQQPYQQQQQLKYYPNQSLVEISAVNKQDNQIRNDQIAQSIPQIKLISNNVEEVYENNKKIAQEQYKLQPTPIMYVQEQKINSSSIDDDDKSENINDKSDSSNQESSTQDSQVKQNIYKSIMNAFKQFLVQKQKIYSLFTNNDKIDNKLKQLARFLKTHSFNHQVLKYIALHETYSIIFSHFINNECDIWLSKSKIIKKEIAVSIINYLKQCVLDKNQFDDFICYKTSKKSKKERDLNLELD